jgi:hypothetical protein
VGSDAALRTWDFRKQKLAGELPLGSAATHLALHSGSDLAAVGCVDRVVRLIDIEACRVVRRFSGHRYVSLVFVCGLWVVAAAAGWWSWLILGPAGWCGGSVGTGTCPGSWFCAFVMHCQQPRFIGVLVAGSAVLAASAAS